MTHPDGSYTQHLAQVRELLARLDERQQDIRGDVLDVKAGLAANARKLAEHDQLLASLSTRQKFIGGTLALVGGGLVTAAVEWLAR
jgi:hypothetical protein